MSQATLAELRNPVSMPAAAPAVVNIGFDTTAGFEALQRMARMFNSSTLVPASFQGNDNLGNAAIALEMAVRMGANPLMVMQNLYVVNGRPAWSAQFLIATLNQSKKFSALRYSFVGKEGQDDWGCRACATELSSGEKLEGPLITIGLAKKEGWFNKNNSKWQSMPELMLRYRAASWFVRAYAPEIAMGLKTADEVNDTYEMELQADGTYSPKDIGTAVTVDEINKQAANTASTETVDAPAQGQESPKRNRPTVEEMTNRRAEACEAWKATGMPLEKAEWEIGGVKADVWNSSQCRRVIALAEKIAADNASSASTGDAPEPENEYAPAPCPKEEGFTPLASVCASCAERTGCPAWDDK